MVESLGGSAEGHVHNASLGNARDSSVDPVMRKKIWTLTFFYVVFFLSGQILNWLCLIHLPTAKLTYSAYCLMMTQCVMNLAGITFNNPYKIAVIHTQRYLLPRLLVPMSGVFHL
jgi:hypothetical protein